MPVTCSSLRLRCPHWMSKNAILKVVTAIQYIRLLGLPLEQLASTSEQLTTVQEHNRRLRTVHDALIFNLLAGRARSITAVTAACGGYVMTSILLPSLCGAEGCRLPMSHKGKHDAYPTNAWAFMQQKDKDKLTKAGFATPRGGNKGAYQNHVLRSNKVILPYERLGVAPLAQYQDGFVIRLYPEQFFLSAGVIAENFLTGADAWIKVGDNAFVLYRTHDAYTHFPPLPIRSVRSLLKDGAPVKEQGRGVVDVGHYVLRISSLGRQQRKSGGAPQGVFARNMPDQETNYLSQCVLAWLIVQTHESPYTTTQANHLQAILYAEGLFDARGIRIQGGDSTWSCELSPLPAFRSLSRASRYGCFRDDRRDRRTGQE